MKSPREWLASRARVPPLSFDRVVHVISRLTFPGFRVSLWGLDTLTGERFAGPRLETRYRAQDTDGRLGEGELVSRSGPPMMLESDDVVVEWVRKELHRIVAHEIDERLLLDGVPVFHPHRDPIPPGTIARVLAGRPLLRDVLVAADEVVVTGGAGAAVARLAAALRNLRRAW